MVTHGVHKYYKDLRSVIMIADGGSTDDTREVSDVLNQNTNRPLLIAKIEKPRAIERLEKILMQQPLWQEQPRRARIF